MTLFSYNPVPKPDVKPKYTKICKCGKEYPVKRCHLNDASRKYCSLACSKKYFEMNKKATIKSFDCPQCGKHFERALGQWNRGKNTYCSDVCAKTAKRRRVLLNCKQCGAQYETKLSKEKEGSKFCSRSCWNEWIKDNPNTKLVIGTDNTGTKNGQYKHGKYAGKGRPGGSSLKKKVKEQVVVRDGGAYCLLCGKPGPGLHLHRVIYGSQCGEYELGNCVQLCNVDHALVHSNKKKWQPVLKEYLSESTPFMRNVLVRFRQTYLKDKTLT